jgi:hypothetical protein
MKWSGLHKASSLRGQTTRKKWPLWPDDLRLTIDVDPVDLL